MLNIIWYKIGKYFDVFDVLAENVCVCGYTDTCVYVDIFLPKCMHIYGYAHTWCINHERVNYSLYLKNTSYINTCRLWRKTCLLFPCVYVCMPARYVVKCKHMLCIGYQYMIKTNKCMSTYIYIYTSMRVRVLALSYMCVHSHFSCFHWEKMESINMFMFIHWLMRRYFWRQY